MSNTLEQALHIFRKDARRLRLEIAGAMLILLLFIATGIQTWDDILERGRADDFDGPFIVLLPLIAVLLIARVIQDEALPGDRHFWLTRPYSRTGLVTAKLIFIGAFIHAPLLIAQAAIILLCGLPLTPYLAGLLWFQVAVFHSVVAPTVAVAALTRNLAQFLPAAILTMTLIAIPVSGHDWGGDLDWIQSAAGILAAFIIATLVVWRQYRLRRTLQTAAFATAGSILAAIFYLAFPQSAAVAIQTSVVGAQDSQFSLRLDAPQPLTSPRRNTAERYGIVELPLTPTGANEADLRVKPVSITFRTLAGDIRRAYSRVNNEKNRGLVQVTFLDPDYIQRAKSAPVSMEAEYLVAQYGPGQSASVPMNGTPTFVDGLGQCGAFINYDQRAFVCRSAFREPAALKSDRILTVGPNNDWWSAYTPFPAELRLHPVFPRHYAITGPAATDLAPTAPEPAETITAMRPVAYFRYTLRIPDIRLADYAVPPKENREE